MTECWEWHGARSSAGYGQMRIGGKLVYTHRRAYELLVGPIPSGHELDHLCRNPACWRPDHLQPVPHRVNMRRGNGFSGLNFRKSVCDRGHHLTPANTYWRKDRYGRECLTCRNDRNAARYRPAA